MLRQELTREEKDKLAERLLPGERILWQGKSRSGWFKQFRKEWKNIPFLIFFAAAFGRGGYVVVTGPPDAPGRIPFLAVAGLCCFLALLMALMILADSIVKSARINAFLHALTNRRLISVGPSSDGRGTRFLQFDGAELRKIRLVLNRNGTGDLIFRYAFPPIGEPVPQGWIAIPEVEEVYKQVNCAFPGVIASRLQSNPPAFLREAPKEQPGK